MRGLCTTVPPQTPTPSTMVPHTPTKRGGVIALHQSGLPPKDIVKQLKWPKSTISYTLKRFRETGSCYNRPKSGRPPSLTPRNKRSILRDILLYPRHPWSFFAEPYGVCPTTIRDLAASDGLARHIVRCKPFLTARHIMARKQWAIDNKDRDWRRVIFTDEASFELGKCRRSWTTRRAGEELLERHVDPCFRSGRKSQMVWGAIARGRKFPLVFFEAWVNQLGYLCRQGCPWTPQEGCAAACPWLGRCSCGGRQCPNSPLQCVRSCSPCSWHQPPSTTAQFT